MRRWRRRRSRTPRSRSPLVWRCVPTGSVPPGRPDLGDAASLQPRTAQRGARGPFSTGKARTPLGSVVSHRSSLNLRDAGFGELALETGKGFGQVGADRPGSDSQQLRGPLLTEVQEDPEGDHFSLAPRQSQNEGNELWVGRSVLPDRDVGYVRAEPSDPSSIRSDVVQRRAGDPRLGRWVSRDVRPSLESTRERLGYPVVGERLITRDDEERPIDLILRSGEEALEALAPAVPLHHRCKTPEAATPFTS